MKPPNYRQTSLTNPAVRYQLAPFDLEETAAYVKHNLRVASAQAQLLSDSFIAGLFDYTKGVARQINSVEFMHNNNRIFSYQPEFLQLAAAESGS